ncbi:MAG TPA: hypothetical protein VFZ10_04105, partial [Geminicoccaceae bacterium]
MRRLLSLGRTCRRLGAQGRRLFTLVRAGAPDLLVVTLVPLRALTDIREHHTASIALCRRADRGAGRLARSRFRAAAARGVSEPGECPLAPQPGHVQPADRRLDQMVFSRVPETMLIVAGLRRRLG